ncbi:MAG: hypothetical protein NTZ01_06465, partial [Verrucomicrobia bacterium]|nr:hypothetical protein [Verrucomicrobiota bacterium]
QPHRPGTPSIKIETAVEAEGDQVGGVTQFPAGVYRPIGRTEGGTYYEFDKPLTAKLLADTVPTKGGLYVPDDPNRPALGWYNMPAGAPEAVIAPEQGTVGSYGGDPVAAANNPYDSADDTLMRHRVRLSSVPKFVEIPQ